MKRTTQMNFRGTHAASHLASHVSLPREDVGAERDNYELFNLIKGKFAAILTCQRAGEELQHVVVETI